jgi:serine/threonine-protein kinase RsbW
MLTSSQPATWGNQVRQWVLDNPTELKNLRSSLYAALTGRPILGGHLDDVPEKMVLVATELATNALRHGRPPTIVTLYRTAVSSVLDVADHDPEILPEFADARPAGAGGLGLRLAREFALDIGWFVSDTTKHVWAEFPLTTAADPAAPS